MPPRNKEIYLTLEKFLEKKPDHDITQKTSMCLKTILEDKQAEIPAALTLLQKLAKLPAPPSVDAKVLLGLCYQEGLGLEVNLNLGVALFTQAAHNLSPVGQFCLGNCYRFGIGVTRDLAKAIELYQLAAHQGLSVAQFKLGELYEKELQKFKEAMEYYKQAAIQGMAIAQNNLGFCFEYYVKYPSEESKTATKNTVTAAMLYSLAAMQGYEVAENNLGRCLEHGIGVEKDAQEAFRYYLSAAKKGFDLAEYNVGMCYRNGLGTKKDLKRSFYYLSAAAKKDNPYAQNELAYCYEKGLGVPIDNLHAVILYRQAAEQGYVIAKVNLAFRYQYGLVGLNKSTYRAALLYQTASDQGLVMSEAAWMEFIMSQDGQFSIHHTPKRYYHFFLKNINRQNNWMQGLVGFCLQFGFGTSQDLTKALDDYEKSMDFSYSNFMDLLSCQKSRLDAKLIRFEEVIQYFQKKAEKPAHRSKALLCLNFLYKYADFYGYSDDPSLLSKAYEACKEAAQLSPDCEETQKQLAAHVSTLNGYLRKVPDLGFFSFGIDTLISEYVVGPNHGLRY